MSKLTYNFIKKYKVPSYLVKIDLQLPEKTKYDSLRLITFSRKSTVERHFSAKKYKIISVIEDSPKRKTIINRRGKKDFIIDIFFLKKTDLDPEGGNIIGDIAYYIGKLPNIIQNLPELFKGVRTIAPPAVRSFLRDYGDILISSLSVCKMPVQEFVQKSLTLITLGKFDEYKKQLNYDDMFHLYLLARAPNGKNIVIEKNAVARIEFIDDVEVSKISNNCMKVDLNNNNYTINQLINNTNDAIGDNQMWVYDPQTQNCQWFLKNILEVNGLLTKELKDFIMQDAKKIISQLPDLTQRLFRGATDMANFLDILVHGRGLTNTGKRIKLNIKKK